MQQWGDEIAGKESVSTQRMTIKVLLNALTVPEEHPAGKSTSCV